jgi:hypothetical protein
MLDACVLWYDDAFFEHHLTKLDHHLVHKNDWFETRFPGSGVRIPRLDRPKLAYPVGT